MTIKIFSSLSCILWQQTYQLTPVQSQYLSGFDSISYGIVEDYTIKYQHPSSGLCKKEFTAQIYSEVERQPL